MKNNLFTYLWAFLIILFSSCGGSNLRTDNDSLGENATDHVFDFQQNGYAGTYQFTDEKGVTCTIILNDDGSMTAQSSKSDEVKRGKWSVYNNECPKLSFDDKTDPLFFTFPEGKEQKIKQAINDGVIAEDGYIYAMNIYLDNKKEDKRLPIKKIN